MDDKLIIQIKNIAYLYETQGCEAIQSPYYKRTCEILEEAFNFRTNNIEPYLKKFTRRENDVEFEQRKILTQNIVGAIYNGLSNPIDRVFRVAPIVQKVGVDDTIKQKIETIEKTFYETATSGRGVKAFLATKFKEVYKFDPNAVIFIDWETKDEKSLPTAFPTVVYSKNIWNRQRINGRLSSVLREDNKKVTYETGNTARKETVTEVFHRFALHTEGYITIANRVLLGDNIEGELYEIEIKLANGKKKKVYYDIKQIETKAPINCVEVGNIYDTDTLGETFVTPFYQSHAYIHKIIKTNSELDLSISLHVFPRLFEYVNKCQGQHIDGRRYECNYGYTEEGHKCKECDGLGVKTHKSGQDVKYMMFPEGASNSDIVDLNKLSTYITTPTDIVEWLKNYVDEHLLSQIHRATYNTDLLIKQNDIVKTATEINSDMQPIYDVLYTFSEKVGSVWSHIMKIFVALSLGDPEQANIQYVSTKDFKMKTRDQLLAELKVLNESGISSGLRMEIINDIAQSIFADDAKKLRRFEIVSNLQPFFGKTDGEVNTILGLELTAKEDKVLFLNFDTILYEVEKQLKKDGKTLVDVTMDEIETMMLAQLAVYMQKLDAQTPQLQFNIGA